MAIERTATTEQKIYHDGWSDCSEKIREVLLDERRSGLYALTEPIAITRESPAAPWLEEQYAAGDDADGVKIQARTPVPLTRVLAVEQDWSPSSQADLLAKTADLAQKVAQQERRVMSKALEAAPNAERLNWKVDSKQRPLDVFEAGGHSDMGAAHLLWNVGAAPFPYTISDTPIIESRLGATVVMARFGPDNGHLFVPKGAVKIHQAGSFDYYRPAEKQFAVEVVSAISLHPSTAKIVVLEPQPTA